jgi:multidrug transporter EmrE-like cation transporter
VRTLALVEVLFSYAVGRGVLRQKVAGHEVAGLVLVVAGVALLLLSA